MKIINLEGEELLAAKISVNEDNQLCTHTSFAGAAELDMPKLNVSFKSEKEGLLIHLGLAGTEKACDVLLEYDDIKTLRQVPGKGLVSFALKAFR